MPAGPVQRDEMRLLARCELGLLAAQATLGLGKLHALARARANQVGFELGDHGQHVEQEASDRVGRVVHRATEVELDLALGEVVDDVARVGQRACEAVKLRHHKRVAGATGGERLPQPGPIATGTG